MTGPRVSGGVVDELVRDGVAGTQFGELAAAHAQAARGTPFAPVRNAGVVGRDATLMKLIGSAAAASAILTAALAASRRQQCESFDDFAREIT